MPETPDAIYERGMAMLPTWDDSGPDVDARRESAIAVIHEAATAGSHEAVAYLADWGTTEEVRLRWGKVLADTGDFGPLSSLLTDGDMPAAGQEVLAAARAGEPWAATALGYVYGMGMCNADGVDLATIDGSYGWMPAVPDPEAEALLWTQRAADAGYGPAQLRLVEGFVPESPARAHELVTAALAWDRLLPVLRTRAEQLAADLLDELGGDLNDRIAERERQAAVGDAAAQVWLGDRLRTGDGMAPDLARARTLYQQAADGGDVAGLRELGRMLEEGLGGPADLDAARECYEEAAELGADTFARTRLVERWGLDWYALDPDEQG